MLLTFGLMYLLNPKQPEATHEFTNSAAHLFASTLSRRVTQSPNDHKSELFDERHRCAGDESRDFSRPKARCASTDSSKDAGGEIKAASNTFN